MAKPFLTYEQQIAHLSSKNMIINNPQFAKQMLMEIGYFSLIIAYKNSFKNPTTKNYDDDVTFEDIVLLYRFDEELRHAFLTLCLHEKCDIMTPSIVRRIERWSQRITDMT